MSGADSQDDREPGAGAEPSVGEVARAPWADQPGVAVEDLQRLWAPWRFGYIADDDRIEGCPFCVLPGRDPDRDRDSLILHRDEHAYVVLNAYPYNPGHLMVVPYVHEGRLAAVAQEVADQVWSLGRRAVTVLEGRLASEGVNLGMNLGTAAGAGITDHLHLHVVPRWTGDTNFISVVGASRVLPRALHELYDDLRPAFRDGTARGG